MSVERTLQTLNNLLQSCRDAEQGFRAAAADVKDPELARLFGADADQRRRFAADLEQEIQRLGGEPVGGGGSAAGTLHRGWMTLRSALTSGEARSVIAEAERGEDVSKAAYEAAMREALPPDVMPMVAHQFARVREAHDRLRSLRDEAA